MENKIYLTLLPMLVLCNFTGNTDLVTTIATVFAGILAFISTMYWVGYTVYCIMLWEEFDYLERYAYIRTRLDRMLLADGDMYYGRKE